MIGAPRDRVDGRAKVTGSARYAADNGRTLSAPTGRGAQRAPGDIVHAVVVPASIPSGTIKSIDTTNAKKAPGVIAVLSHLNAPKLNPPPAQAEGGGQPSGNFAEPHYIPFSDATVHYVG